MLSALIDKWITAEEVRSPLRTRRPHGGSLESWVWFAKWRSRKAFLHAGGTKWAKDWGKMQICCHLRHWHDVSRVGEKGMWGGGIGGGGGGEHGGGEGGEEGDDTPNSLLLSEWQDLDYFVARHNSHAVKGPCYHYSSFLRWMAYPPKLLREKPLLFPHSHWGSWKRGDEILNTSSPFPLWVWTAHPRPKVQGATSEFVEKFTLGGRPRM